MKHSCPSMNAAISCEGASAPVDWPPVTKVCCTVGKPMQMIISIEKLTETCEECSAAQVTYASHSHCPNMISSPAFKFLSVKHQTPASPLCFLYNANTLLFPSHLPHPRALTQHPSKCIQHISQQRLHGMYKWSGHPEMSVRIQRVGEVRR